MPETPRLSMHHSAPEVVDHTTYAVPLVLQCMVPPAFVAEVIAPRMVLSANIIGDWLRVKLDPQLRQL